VAGGFVDGRSDVDLLAVVEEDVDEDRLERLRMLHSEFVERHPEWVERVEVAYVARRVLRTLGDAPAGALAVVSPGEPLHVKPVDLGWTVNWYSVVTQSEVIVGSPPLDLGPAVSERTFRRAVAAQLTRWKNEVRAPSVAYVPVHRGYIVVTICRALYALAHGRQASKDEAVAWVAERSPEWSALVHDALAHHRADVGESHREAIRFVDHACAEASRRD
jgi:hypothetical protein